MLRLPSVPKDPVWGRERSGLALVVRNVGTRYAVVGVDVVIGLLILPINIYYLGQSAWGLWMLTGSLATYFTVMDLGYGGSLTKFVAQYRARRDAQAINEIVSTLFVVFLGLAVVTYAGFALLAFNASAVFNLTPEQAELARWLILLSSLQVALGFPFSVFGGVMNGFQRYDLNSAVSIVTSIVVAGVNVGILLAGYGVVEVVAGITVVRLLSKLAFRLNAYWVFPGLRVRPSLFRRERLREISGFSVWMAIIGWANRLNYATDAFVIAAFLSPAAVAIWSVPRRITELIMKLTNQFNGVLLPVVVDSDTRRQATHLQAIFIHWTRVTLFAALPCAAALFLLADILIPAWVGPGFEESVAIAQVLAVVIALRVGQATASVVLKGAGQHRMLAINNGTVALANVALSILWIRGYGLLGVAWATLLPLAAGTIFSLWPTAARRVGLSGFEAFRRAVWPVLWPLPSFVAPVLGVRALMPAGVPTAVLAGAAGALCYAAVMIAFALPADERAFYRAKIARLLPRRRAEPAAAA